MKFKSLSRKVAHTLHHRQGEVGTEALQQLSASIKQVLFDHEGLN